MRPFHHHHDRAQAELDAPPSRGCALFRVLFLVFLASFVFDYKSAVIEFGAASTGGSPIQFAFLALALLSGGAASLLGWRRLLTRPGVYLVILWWAYILFSIAVAVLAGNEWGRILRLLIPSLLVGLAINLTMICSCSGMRPGEMVRWFLIAGVINVIWKFVFGTLISGVPLSEVRMEILSPAMRFLFAWSACAFLLRRRFSPWIPVVFGIPLVSAALSITRSMVLPLFVSFLMAAVCLGLGMLWRMYDVKHVLRKVSLVAAAAAGAFGILLLTMIALPTVGERWYQRVFDNAGQGGATTEDLSTLMRKAEAEAMWEILSDEPAAFLYGKGLGASYYWDEAYYPELFLVYPEDRHQFPFAIHSAGHSIWTYTLFSRGFLGVGAVLGAFLLAMGFSLRAAYLNAGTVMGPRAWDAFLVFVPFVAVWATLSESITRNPFDERFTGVLLGILLVFPQFFFNRAYYLRYREKCGQETPQLILDEESLPEEFADGAEEGGAEKSRYPGEWATGITTGEGKAFS